MTGVSHNNLIAKLRKAIFSTTHNVTDRKREELAQIELELVRRLGIASGESSSYLAERAYSAYRSKIHRTHPGQVVKWVFASEVVRDAWVMSVEETLKQLGAGV